MRFNWDLRVPFRYGDSYVTLRWLEQHLLTHYHPEYVRRLIGWLHFKGGKVGVGGDWRARGTQPDKNGFAPEGRSFHQDQLYADNFYGACAVDTVYEDGPDLGDDHDGIAWREVPQQGSVEATRWGVHANVGVPGKGESWHIQPVEIDGWQSWYDAGRPAPQPGYPLPFGHDPYAPTPEPPEEIIVASKNVVLIRWDGFADQLEASYTSQDTKRASGLEGAPVVVLPFPDSATRAKIEAELGRKLTPLKE